MDPAPDLPTTNETTTSRAGSALFPRGPADRAAAARLVALVMLAIAALVFGADRLTASPALCGSCHEMGRRAAAWQVSPHARIACVSCHVPPRPWYEFPRTLYDRTALLGHNAVMHFAGNDAETIDSRLVGQTPMSDAVCLQCHDPNRKATSGFRIRINHAEHAKRNGSCVSCHITVAHPTPSRGTAMSFMAQCFTCHGTSKTAKAPATCSLCHPAGYELLPASHKAAAWKRGHGRVALSDPAQCRMCHTQAVCDGCHGMRMPHPKEWAQSTGHPVYAQRDRAVCTRCHTGKPDFCTMCHHKAYNPAAGTWVQQHYQEVERKGASFCLDCHSPVYCARCHVRPAPG